MGHHREPAVKTEAFVYVEVVCGPREQTRYFIDFTWVFIDVSLKQEALVLGEEGLADLEHGL